MKQLYVGTIVVVALLTNSCKDDKANPLQVAIDKEVPQWLTKGNGAAIRLSIDNSKPGGCLVPKPKCWDDYYNEQQRKEQHKQPTEQQIIDVVNDVLVSPEPPQTYNGITVTFKE